MKYHLHTPDAFTLKSASKITLQPGEEKEEVLIYFEEDKWVEQYTYRYDKDIGKGVYGDLVYSLLFSFFILSFTKSAFLSTPRSLSNIFPCSSI